MKSEIEKTLECFLLIKKKKITREKILEYFRTFSLIQQRDFLFDVIEKIFLNIFIENPTYISNKQVLENFIGISYLIDILIELNWDISILFDPNFIGKIYYEYDNEEELAYFKKFYNQFIRPKFIKLIRKNKSFSITNNYKNMIYTGEDEYEKGHEKKMKTIICFCEIMEKKITVDIIQGRLSLMTDQQRQDFLLSMALKLTKNVKLERTNGINNERLEKNMNDFKYIFNLLLLDNWNIDILMEPKFIIESDYYLRNEKNNYKNRFVKNYDEVITPLINQWKYDFANKKITEMNTVLNMPSELINMMNEY